jgi:hypothetical protein
MRFFEASAFHTLSNTRSSATPIPYRRCNLCGASNDVPSSYFCHLDANGQRRDKDQRPELCTGSVELVAPAEYMVRPPQVK